MELERYEIIEDSSKEVFAFISEGEQGSITKAVRYRKMGGGIYNLAFGDWDSRRMRINDKARSNNGDRKKVLATVAMTALDFLEAHPDAIIDIKGSTPARTRLYQMGINLYYYKMKHLFVISGLYNDNWEIFQANKNYDAFQVRRR
ncbi:MAG TPA: hypothetical protein VHM26_19050 [Chitinophagaceae bacterium]|nr:hypothetical protein [Chitinophagaceae bacterium]